IQEQIRSLRQQLRRLAEELEEARRPRRAVPALPVRFPTRSIYAGRESEPHRNLLAEMAAAQDLLLYLEELAGQAAPVIPDEGIDRARLVRQAALLDTLAFASSNPGEEEVLVYLWSAAPGGERWVTWLEERYHGGGLTPELSGGPDEGSSGQTWWQLERL